MQMLGKVAIDPASFYSSRLNDDFFLNVGQTCCLCAMKDVRRRSW